MLSPQAITALESAIAATAAATAAVITWRIAKESRKTNYTISRAKIVGKITWDRDSGDAHLVLTNYGGMASNLILGPIQPAKDNPFNLYAESYVVRNGIPYIGPSENIRFRIGRDIGSNEMTAWSAPAVTIPRDVSASHYPHKLRIDYQDWISKEELHETIDLRLDSRIHDDE